MWPPEITGARRGKVGVLGAVEMFASVEVGFFEELMVFVSADLSQLA